MGGTERALQRPGHLPGLVVFYGPSGYGKSWAATAVGNHSRAYYVECKSTWTKKYLAGAMLREMGLPGAGSIPELIERISHHLAETRRPLIVDEADFLVGRGMIELIRDIYMGSEGTIILIGEEMLPAKLEKTERVHGRVLDWIAAQPADLSDARHLARIYAPGLAIADDLLARIVGVGQGSVRRICVNIDRVREAALVDGLEAADLAWWGERELYSGRPPARRAA